LIRRLSGVAVSVEVLLILSFYPSLLFKMNILCPGPYTCPEV
jgi:hypothetical protein